MRIADWVDVELEGRARVLQRALAEYRALRRGLGAVWRDHCQALAESCERLAASERNVDEAIERAQRRIRQGAAGAAALLEAVERERARLIARAGAIFTELDGREAPRGGSAILLSALSAALREEAPLDSAWRQFARERTSFLGAAGLFAAAAPPLSWWHASEGGEVPTRFNLGALLESPSATAAVLTAGLLVFAWQLRAASWSWLGVKAPARAVALVALTGLVAWWLWGGENHRLEGVLIAGLLGLVIAAAASFQKAKAR